MKKNAFLTFIFACIPGAGQMYYGYMKRGLSMITFFCLFIMAGTLVDVLVVGSIIVWMYSFFDTYGLIRHLAAGEPKDDDLLLPGSWDDIKAMLGGEDGIPHTGMDERSWNSEKHAYGWFNGEGDYYVLYFVVRDGDEYYTAATFSSSVRGDS